MGVSHAILYPSVCGRFSFIGCWRCSLFPSFCMSCSDIILFTSYCIVLVPTGSTNSDIRFLALEVLSSSWGHSSSTLHCSTSNLSISSCSSELMPPSNSILLHHFIFSKHYLCCAWSLWVKDLFIAISSSMVLSIVTLPHTLQLICSPNKYENCSHVIRLLFNVYPSFFTLLFYQWYDLRS